MPPLPENPKGFFELWDIYQANNAILSAFKSSWYLFHSLPNNWEDYLEIYKQKDIIKIILEKEFENDTLFVLKDPRIGVLFPIYETVFKELSIDLKIVVINRDDFQVANSLSKRDTKFSLLYGLMLSRFYQSEIARYTMTKCCFEIKFDNLLLSPLETLHSMFAFHDIDYPINEAMKTSVNSFLDIELRHHSPAKSIWQLVKRWLYLFTSQILFCIMRSTSRLFQNPRWWRVSPFTRKSD